MLKSLEYKLIFWLSNLLHKGTWQIFTIRYAKFLISTLTKYHTVMANCRIIFIPKAKKSVDMFNYQQFCRVIEYSKKIVSDLQPRILFSLSTGKWGDIDNEVLTFPASFNSTSIKGHRAY